MQAIANRTLGAAVSLAEAARGKEPLRMPQAEEKEPGNFKKDERDAYIPQKACEPFGRYWPGTDEAGNPRVYFDDPLQAEGIEGEEKERASGSPKKQPERCVGNTDAVDREIETLKKEREMLRRSIEAETDEEKLRALKAKLSQVESQLRQKDTDAYRRQHTTFQ